MNLPQAMAEDAEGRFKRAMDRIFSSPSTPTSNSAAAASASKEGSKGRYMENEGLDRPKGSAIAKQGVVPCNVPGISSIHTNLHSNPPSVCRPWDRGDLFKRLATFKSMTWFGNREVAGPVNCARKGWVNVDVDLISCESCNAKLSFPSSSTWSQQQAESTAASFSEKLETAHKALCPWKGNICSETLAQFPPTPAEALIEGFKDRCDALYQLSVLPVISDSAIHQMRLLKGPQIDRLLAQPPNIVLPEEILNDGAESTGEDSICTYYQAQRLISLCGWEPRLLPYVVDFEDDSLHLVRKSTCLDSHDKITSRRHSDPGPSVLLYSKAEGTEQGGNHNKFSYPEQRPDIGSAVLDCSLCGASAGLWFFNLIARPSHWKSAQREEEIKTDFAPSTCGFSAASGIERGCSNDLKSKDQIEKPDETSEAVTSILAKSGSRVGVLDLKLTIAGGPPPTQLNNCRLNPRFYTPNPLTQPGVSQPENTRVGEGNGRSTQKRKRNEHSVLEDRQGFEHDFRDLPRYSSVDAMDTCFQSRRETSAESVEMPEEADNRGTVVSRDDNDDVVHAQQRTYVQAIGVSENITALSTSTGKDRGTCVVVEHSNSRGKCGQETEQTIPSSDKESRGVRDNAEVIAIVTESSGLFSEDKGQALEVVATMEGNSGENEGLVTKNKNIFCRETTEAFKAEVVPESSIGATLAAERVPDLGMLWEKETTRFDPVLQHRHFCPWANVNTMRPGNNIHCGAMCGWQLTLDALEASPVRNVSESASSMYNSDPLGSVRKIFRKSKACQKKSKKQ